MGWFKDAIKSITSETKKAVTNIRDTSGQIIHTIQSEVKKVVPNSVKNAPWVMLQPFKGVMIQALDKKGVVHTNDIWDIAPKFANHIVKGQNFQDSTHEFYGGGVGILHDENNFSVYNADGDGVNWGEVAKVALLIIPQIIKYFKDLKAKKEAGKALTAQEAAILAGAEEVADAIVGDTGAVSELKDFLFSWKGLALLAVIGTLIYLNSGKK